MHGIAIATINYRDGKWLKRSLFDIVPVSAVQCNEIISKGLCISIPYSIPFELSVCDCLCFIKLSFES